MIITANLHIYLSQRFDNTIAYHESKQRTITLTFEEYIELIEYRGGMARLQIAHNKHEESGNSSFRYGYVLTWRDHLASLDKIVSKNTMAWYTSDKSKVIGKMQKGEKHSEASKQLMSQKRQKDATEHNANISKALTGRKQSPEHCAARKAMWAAKREAKALAQLQEHQPLLLAAPYSWQRWQVMRCFLTKPSRMSSIGAPIARVIGSSSNDKVNPWTSGHCGSRGWIYFGIFDLLV